MQIFTSTQYHKNPDQLESQRNGWGDWETHWEKSNVKFQHSLHLRRKKF